MRRIVTICFLLLLALPAAAQFTNVTGTVVDPNGVPYALGTISASLTSSGTPTLSGLAYSPPTAPAGLDINGTFLLRLGDNAVLAPGGSTWKFTVCSGTGTVQPAAGSGSVCFTLSGVTITGASQDISAQLNAAAVALTRGVSRFGVGSSAAALTDTSAFSGTTCATLLAATTAVTSGNIVTTGSLSGHIACPTNPIASAFRGEVLVMAAVYHLQTSASSWVIPTSVILRGMGKTSATVTINNGTVVQLCNAANDNAQISLLFCNSATFPSDVPAICFITCSTTGGSIGFDARIEEFTVDVNNILRGIGVANYWIQENGGVRDSFILHWANSGIGIDHGANTNTAQNSAYISVDFANESGTTTCTTSAVAIRIWGAGPKEVKNVTATSSACPGANEPNDLFQVISNAVTLEDVHVEQWQRAAFNFGVITCQAATTPGCSGAGDVGGTTTSIVCIHCQGSNDDQNTGDLIRISNGAGGLISGSANVRGVNLVNAAISTPNRPTNIINDQNAIPITPLGGVFLVVSSYITNMDRSVYADSSGVNIEIRGFQVTSAERVLTVDLSLVATTAGGVPIGTGFTCTGLPSNSFCWSLPGIARKYDCAADMLYSQATAVVANAWGVQSITFNPTLINAWGRVQTAVGPPIQETSGTVINILNTTATDIVVYTPGVINTLYQAHLEFTVANAANAGAANVVAITGRTGAAGDAITIKAGSKASCYPSQT